MYSVICMQRSEVQQAIIFMRLGLSFPFSYLSVNVPTDYNACNKYESVSNVG